jgi:hypothetical protein
MFELYTMAYVLALEKEYNCEGIKTLWESIGWEHDCNSLNDRQWCEPWRKSIHGQRSSYEEAESRYFETWLDKMWSLEGKTFMDV